MLFHRITHKTTYNLSLFAFGPSLPIGCLALLAEAKEVTSSMISLWVSLEMVSEVQGGAV